MGKWLAISLLSICVGLNHLLVFFACVQVVLCLVYTGISHLTCALVQFSVDQVYDL